MRTLLAFVLCLLLASAGWGQGAVIQGAIKNAEEIKLCGMDAEGLWPDHCRQLLMSNPSPRPLSSMTCIHVTDDLIEPNYDDPDCWPESKRPTPDDCYAWVDGNCKMRWAVDMPAIHKPAPTKMTIQSNCNTESGVCFGGAVSCTNNGTMVYKDGVFDDKCVDGWEWTCQDRSRILLTDESGGKHCVKFQ